MSSLAAYRASIGRINNEQAGSLTGQKSGDRLSKQKHVRGHRGLDVYRTKMIGHYQGYGIGEQSLEK